ncbi:hypothetical protein JTB14_025222 [Gonioctena quinquepunctata]|nr:hypothetical protein JTB14_025222 [Gonioctena quinquepunctata]
MKVVVRLRAYLSLTALGVSGPLIDNIASHFENIINNVTGTPKFLMLSGHDTTISALLETLQISDHQIPEYASMLIFELRSEENKNFVNILHKNETYSSDIVERTLSKCEFDCEWDEFKSIVEPFRLNMEQWEKECWKNIS